MKRCLAALLALFILALSASALGETARGPEPIPGEAPIAIDLDGDGALETVSWRMAPGERADAALTLTVESAGGEAQRYATGILSGGTVTIVDLNGDGMQEVLMTGDVMSDDYYTWCLHYDRGALYEVKFPDCQHGNSEGVYSKYGYGLITAMGDNLLTLTGTQEMLGAWLASRTLTLSASGNFEFDDTGLWLRSLDGTGEDDPWDYGVLTVTAALPYTDLQGDPAGTLESGAQIIIYATDKRSIALFASRDGASGCLAISHEDERGWLVNGIPEAECLRLTPLVD